MCAVTMGNASSVRSHSSRFRNQWPVSRLSPCGRNDFTSGPDIQPIQSPRMISLARLIKNFVAVVVVVAYFELVRGNRTEALKVWGAHRLAQHMHSIWTTVHSNHQSRSQHTTRLHTYIHTQTDISRLDHMIHARGGADSIARFFYI